MTTPTQTGLFKDPAGQVIYSALMILVSGLFLCTVFYGVVLMYNSNNRHVLVGSSPTCQMNGPAAIEGCALVGALKSGAAAKDGGQVKAMVKAMASGDVPTFLQKTEFADGSVVLCWPKGEKEARALDSDTLRVVEAMGAGGGIVVAPHSISGAFGGWAMNDARIVAPVGSLCIASLSGHSTPDSK